MQEDHIPKRLLFGWLTHRRPMHGCKLRWRDRVRKDLKRFKIDEGRWYRDAKERGVWRAQCREGLDTCTKERLEDRIRREAALTITGTTPALIQPLLHLCVTHATDRLGEGRTLQGISVRQLATKERQ